MCSHTACSPAAFEVALKRRSRSSTWTVHQVEGLAKSIVYNRLALIFQPDFYWRIRDFVLLVSILVDLLLIQGFRLHSLSAVAVSYLSRVLHIL